MREDRCPMVTVELADTESIQVVVVTLVACTTRES